MSSLKDRKIGIWAAVLTGLCWGVLAIGLKVALKFADSQTIVWFRMVFAFTILLIFVGLRQPSHLKILLKPPLFLIIGALSLAINYVGYMKGVELTSPSNAQIFIQLESLGLIVVGIFFFKETPSHKQLLGFLLCGLGFAMFYKDRFDATLSQRAAYLTGNLWILLAAGTWVVFAAFQKILLRKGYDPQQLNLFIYGLTAVVLSPMVNWTIVRHLGFSQGLLLAGLGLNTLLAYGGLAVAIQKIPASQVSVIITMNPLLTILIMALLGACEVSWIQPEHIATLGYVASLIVIIGVILAVAKPRPAK